MLAGLREGRQARAGINLRVVRLCGNRNCSGCRTNFFPMKLRMKLLPMNFDRTKGLNRNRSDCRSRSSGEHWMSCSYARSLLRRALFPAASLSGRRMKWIGGYP